jgi:hypothetical protein
VPIQDVKPDTHFNAPRHKPAQAGILWLTEKFSKFISFNQLVTVSVILSPVYALLSKVNQKIGVFRFAGPTLPTIASQALPPHHIR